MAKLKVSDFQLLLDAIVANDLPAAKALVKQNPALTVAGVPEPVLIQTGILHQLYQNDTALHLAAAGGRFKIAEMLIKAGADPNSAKNHRLGRPLHYASDGRSAEFLSKPDQIKTIQCLLNAGADLHAADKNGATALHRAVRTRADLAVESLLEAGADATIPNKSGATAFHLAVQNTGASRSGSEESVASQRRIIQLMRKRGVSVNLKDANGKTVLEWAKSDWIKELLEG